MDSVVHFTAFAGRKNKKKRAVVQRHDRTKKRGSAEEGRVGVREREREVGLACSVETKRGGRMSTGIRACPSRSLCLSVSRSVSAMVHLFRSVVVPSAPFFLLTVRKKREKMVSSGSKASQLARNNTITPFPSFFKKEAKVKDR